MKKIVTVSVLAIMAVSAANADIASTTYVDKAKTAVEGQITDLSGVVATKAAQADLNTLGGRVTTAEGKITDNTTEIGKKAAQTVVDALSGKVGDVSLSGTNYMKDDTNLTAAVKSLDTQLSNVAGGNLAIKPGAVGTTELADGSVTDAKLGADVKEKYATKSELPTAVSDLTNDSKFQTESEVSSAIATATTGMAKTSDIHNAALTIKVNGTEKGSFTANAATAAEVDIPVPTKVSDLTNDKNYQTADNVTATLNNYYTKDAANAEFYNEAEVNSAITTAVADGGAVKNVIDTALASYSTTEQMNTELNKKIDKTSESSLNVATAVKATQDASGNVITATYATKSALTEGLNAKLDDTATGSATLPIYIDDKGVAQTITSYSGKAATAGAADTATTAGTADNYNETSGTIQAKFAGVDTSLAKVAPLGSVPVPDKCKTDAFDCTLVVKYDQAANAAVPQWEAIAR